MHVAKVFHYFDRGKGRESAPGAVEGPDRLWMANQVMLHKIIWHICGVATLGTADSLAALQLQPFSWRPDGKVWLWHATLASGALVCSKIHLREVLELDLDAGRIYIHFVAGWRASEVGGVDVDAVRVLGPILQNFFAATEAIIACNKSLCRICTRYVFPEPMSKTNLCIT